MDFVNFIFEFSEFYENIILVIKKLSAGLYEIWARRENAGISAFKLLLASEWFAPVEKVGMQTDFDAVGDRKEMGMERFSAPVIKHGECGGYRPYGMGKWGSTMVERSRLLLAVMVR